ncbi:GNAT family N-acetyltransferase [Candidatus Aquiluna sp. UB-MaderosW2red]|uniref:GNAT family N-acetyltransferase n=1 Tax=Candidatus Aquiluna sp. UB-MaderosW2red TaxID=1855377 RepID=UPI000875B22A|nr:Acetyltransferase (GNAT) family protein [Candidatus Aquiluna sp. UB-MaderosW2red]
MRLRRAEPKDLANLTQLMLEFSTEALSPLEKNHIEAAVEPLLTENPHGVILVAQDQELLGYLVMSFGWGIESGGKEALIDEVYISPDARNQGLGRSLAELAIEHAKANGVRVIFLETEKPNDRVRKLYHRIGFEQEDSVWLRKKL